MHISLDGFVAGPAGEMNWIRVDEKIFDFVGSRISQSDTALYGRITYQMMENYWPNAGNEPNASKHDIEHSRWYNRAHKIVLSKTINDRAYPNTTIISDNITEGINKIKNTPGSEILLFGSPTTTHSLIQMNLIDGFWLFVNPIILGKGVRLFPDGLEKTDLNLLTSRTFSNGVTELNYLVNRS